MQKPVSLKPANSSSECCSSVFDQIQILIIQIVSAGYDVCRTSGTMWCETILTSFHTTWSSQFCYQAIRTITKSSVIMAHLKKEITTKVDEENGWVIETAARSAQISAPRSDGTLLLVSVCSATGAIITQ